MAKPLTLSADGSFAEIQPVTISAGATDAAKLAQLDSNGKYDISVMPTGIGADTVSIMTSEALTAGDFVNIYNNTGTMNCRKAIAADNTKPAHGFVLSSYGGSVVASVYVRGLNTAVPIGSYTIADIGKPAFLNTTTGGLSTSIRPVGTSQIVQNLGDIDAIGATATINFSRQNHTVLA